VHQHEAKRACVFLVRKAVAMATYHPASPESRKSQGKIERFLNMAGRMLLAQKLH
jgi:hypothetical protein